MSISALIVDDEAEMRQLLALTLRNLGIDEIFEAANAQDAISTFSVVDLNLVFLDLNMPGEDGFSVLNAIKKHKANAYVIIVSGESSVDTVRKAVTMGAKGFVVKPYQQSKINDVVQRYLDSV
jgi:two-component system chemotaxis response regulator CheY